MLVPTAPLPTQLPAHVAGKAAEDDPQCLRSCTLMHGLDGAPGFGSVLAIEAT